MKRKASAVQAPMDSEAFRVKLKEMGLKATPQRLEVHEAMTALVHASADMVTERIKAAGGARVTVASVYNILSGMSDMGIYSRRMSTGNKMWFDVNSFKHIHAIDSSSGDFIDIIDDSLAKEIEDRLKKIKIKGYRIERADIQLSCKPKKKRI